MGVIDKINQAFVSWLRRREPRPTVVGDAIIVGDQRYEFEDISGAVAYEVDIYAGLVIALTLSFAGGRTVTATQQDPCWNDLLAALDRLAITTTPSREWLIRLMADDRGKPLILLDGQSAVEG